MSQFNKSLIYKIHQLMYCMDAVAEQVIATNTNLNYTEFLVLLALNEKPDSTQEEIALWANFTKSTASKTIDKLVKKSFLSRTENTIDRRQKDLVVTPAGQTEFEIAKRLVEQMTKYVFEVLSPSEIEQLDSIFDKINKDGLANMYKNLPQFLSTKKATK